jgi:hypothetical protein
VQPHAAPVKAGINLPNCNFGLSLWSRMECVYQGKEVRKGSLLQSFATITDSQG